MSTNSPSNNRPGRKKDAFGSLKTTLLIGGIAATAIGTQLIARLETGATNTSTVTTNDVSYTLELQPIPTVVAPSSAAATTSQSDTTAIVPVDTTETEATEDTVQVAPVTQTQTQTFRPRGRSRSS